MQPICRLSLLCFLLGLPVWAAPAGTPDTSSDLSQFSRDTLLSCFSKFAPCETDSWSLAEELKSRGDTAALFERYWRTKDQAIRAGIEKVAYREDSPAARTFLRQVVTRQMDDGEGLYYPLNNIAKHCEETGLRALATGRYRDQGSSQYETSLRLFGRCTYRPAIPYLVDTALFDASLNVIDGAEDSLRKLYPQAPTNFPDLASMRRYFCAQAKAERIRVSCTAKALPSRQE
jgi:hypothetical protein